MKKMRWNASAMAVLCLMALSVPSCREDTPAGVRDTGDMKTIQLPEPKRSGGMPLLTAIKNRRTDRSIQEKELPLEVMSGLLWAAWGINRPDSGMRTAPSPFNWQQTDIYVALKKGIYLYKAQSHILEPVSKGDFRADTCSAFQKGVHDAPVQLIYVSDLSRMKGMGRFMSSIEKEKVALVTAGAICQNVYLFCASENLATVVRGYIPKKELRGLLGLKESQVIHLAQTSGFREITGTS